MDKNNEGIIAPTPAFSTTEWFRLTRDFYIPALTEAKVQQSDYEFARILTSWKHNIYTTWSQVKILPDMRRILSIEHHAKSGEKITISTIVRGSLTPSDVAVEVYYGSTVANMIRQGESTEMTVSGQLDSSTFRYTAELSIIDGGEYGYTFRVYPRHASLFNRFDMPFMKWVNG